MLLWVFKVTVNMCRRYKNVVRKSVTHLVVFLVPLLLHWDIFCDLLLNTYTAAWNLFLRWNAWDQFDIRISFKLLGPQENPLYLFLKCLFSYYFCFSNCTPSLDINWDIYSILCKIILEVSLVWFKANLCWL